MKKNKNPLIKRKNLSDMLKKKGITRANKEALETLESNIEDYTNRIITLIKTNMQINARKTLIKRDILELASQKEENID